MKIVVGEGRHHLVKRLCEAVGLPVLRLFRPEFRGVTVARLRPGRDRDSHRRRRSIRFGARPACSKGPRHQTTFLPLPKAARRHGHGAPEPTAGADAVARSGNPAPSRRRKGREAPRRREAPKGQGKRR